MASAVPKKTLSPGCARWLATGALGEES